MPLGVFLPSACGSDVCAQLPLQHRACLSAAITVKDRRLQFTYMNEVTQSGVTLRSPDSHLHHATLGLGAAGWCEASKED